MLEKYTNWARFTRRLNALGNNEQGGGKSGLEGVRMV